MKPSVYIETTIPSYLIAWRSPELIMAANQEATRSWWESSRPRYEIFISAIVTQEASGGDPEAAKRRVAVIEGLPELDVSEEAELLAERLLYGAALPDNAKTDALHIAVATVHGIDFLLTWNCKHIANAAMRPKIERICKDAGYEPPVICTPLELMEE
ncbi:MAG: type II toxin-antitoxin system VapC family toxin [Desulfosalsimonadaceae bacterium]